jgi:predicted Zn-dependent peptidase
VVALRLAILADDPAGYAGAGHLIQHLVYPSLQEQVARVGGRVEMARSADALVYAVSGPADELVYLAGVLRSALRPPRPSEADLLRAQRELAEERLAEWEVADQHVRSALRVRLFPSDLSAAGSERSAARLTRDVLPLLWSEIYQPERVSIVAVGDVTLAGVQEAFGTLPPPAAVETAGEARDTVSLQPLAPAEATRGWFGVGYLASDLPAAALSVTARLLQQEVGGRTPDSVSVTGEHWWTHHGQAVVLVAAAPASALAVTDAALRGAVGSLTAGLTERRVREAAQALRREMLFYGRTPRQMASLLGAFADHTGDADAAERYFAALGDVDEAQIRAVLRALQAGAPIRVSIPPQKTESK